MEQPFLHLPGAARRTSSSRRSHEASCGAFRTSTRSTLRIQCEHSRGRVCAMWGCLLFWRRQPSSLCMVRRCRASPTSYEHSLPRAIQRFRCLAQLRVRRSGAWESSKRRSWQSQCEQLRRVLLRHSSWHWRAQPSCTCATSARRTSPSQRGRSQSAIGRMRSCEERWLGQRSLAWASSKRSKWRTSRGLVRWRGIGMRSSSRLWRVQRDDA